MDRFSHISGAHVLLHLLPSPPKQVSYSELNFTCPINSSNFLSFVFLDLFFILLTGIELLWSLSLLESALWKKLVSLSEMGFHGSEGGPATKAAVAGADGGKVVVGKVRDCSADVTDDEHEDEGEDVYEKIQLGPRISIKEQLEKDKDDESLRKWKEQLLGSLDIAAVGGENLEPDVKILNLAIKSDNRPDIVLEIPDTGNPKGLWFTLKEGSRYSLNFSFKVKNNIVSGLRYTNTVWKTGIKVDRKKEMLGTFSPQAEAYTHEMPEEVTPSGMFARGIYSARTKFFDDDNKCYLEINYTFDIRKDWNSAQ